MTGVWRAAAVLLLAAAFAPAAAGAQTLSIAAASDLQPVLPEIAKRFEQARGRQVRVTFGSSGNFFAQIRSGAPFDVFLSADIDYPRQLEKAGLAERGTLTRYALGRLVVWARRGSAVKAGVLSGLAAPAVRKIAIANPDHAPYGRAAVAALRHAGVYERVRTRLVFGENVSQAAQFVQSGNADVGLLPLSLARSPALMGAGAFVEVPAAAHPPIEQGAIVTLRARDKAAARAFVLFLTMPEIARLLRASGFEVPAP